MYGRSANEDYSPLTPGSKEYNAAVNARREMLNTLALKQNEQPRDKWRERMTKRAKFFA